MSNDGVCIRQDLRYRTTSIALFRVELVQPEVLWKMGTHGRKFYGKLETSVTEDLMKGE